MSIPVSRRKDKPKAKVEDPSLYPFQAEECTGDLPGEIYGHSTVVHGHSLYLFGGCNLKGIFNNELYKYNIKRKRWKKVVTHGNKPKSRHFHSCIVYNNKMYIFGGKSNGYMNDLHCLDLETMTWLQEDNVSGKPPTKRYGHSAILYNSSMYIFGGYDDFGYKSNEIYEYRLESKEWRKIECTGDAPERFHHSAVLYNGSMYVFGGLSIDKDSTVLFEYRFDTRTWAKVHTIGPPPDARWGHSAIVCNSRMYILGGCDHVLNFKDVYKYNFERCKWSRIKGDGFEPRFFGSAASYKDKVYIYGGRNMYNYCFDDLCTFSADVYRSKFPDSYFEDMRGLLNDKEFSDFVFCFPEEDGRMIYAHKSILAARCQGFRTMLRSGMKECVEGKMEISEVKYHIYQAFLQYLYTGEVPTFNSMEEYLDLLQLSDKYMVEHLKSVVQRLLKKHLTVSNVSILYETALKYKSDELQNFCIKYAVKYYDILPDKKSMNKTFLNEVRSIVEQNRT